MPGQTVMTLRGRLQFIPEAEGSAPIELGPIEIPVVVGFDRPGPTFRSVEQQAKR